MKPVVRFSYFPVWRRFYFSDFSDTAERVERALRSFEIAQWRGWDEVERSMRGYDVLPATFFEDPTAFRASLR